MPELRPRRLINSGEWGLLCLFLLRATRCQAFIGNCYAACSASRRARLIRERRLINIALDGRHYCHDNKPMNVEFDDKKDALNREKHGKFPR